MKVLVCNDDLTGIYSGIYEAWAGKYNRNELELRICDNYSYELFKEYITIEPNVENANKVINTVKRQFGTRFLRIITVALWSYEEDKADAVYNTIRYGIENKISGDYLSNYTMDCIMRVNNLYKNIYNEIHHYYGFVRFAELEERLLFSQIKPKNYCLEALAEHFSDRLPSENWIIYDSGRKMAVVHKSHCQWFVVGNITIDAEDVEKRLSLNEKEHRKLWKLFFNTISITERENPNVQRNNMPIRFREFLTECL